MANTFRIGQFGLTSFDDHNISLSDLIHHFNDNINENFSDVTDPASNIYTDVAKLTRQQRNALYTDVPAVSDPVYEDMIKNT
jgi:hypothetical protein|tara:strand:+ start:941 stop:1186 length:246 start_codon:yes stop_codon:yes gene_type:complete